METKHRNLIGGEWKDAASDAVFEKRDPADSDRVVGLFPDSDAQDIAAAVEAAKKAFPSWAAMTPPMRGRILHKAGELLAKREGELAKILVDEVGKTAKEAAGEVRAGIDMCFFMASQGRGIMGETTSSELPDRAAMTKRYPIGVVGIITPWNFPVSLISWKVFPALICGNAIVLKPAKDAPGVATIFAEALMESGLPPGVLNIVHGRGEKAGEALAKHPDVRMVSFTGSSEVGVRIANICSERLAKVSLELGGKNAVIVMEDADLPLAVSGIVKGAFSVAGERCTSTGRVLVHEQVHDRFIEMLLAETKKLKVGPGNDPSTDVCPLINKGQLENALSFVEKGKAQGAKLLHGGGRLTDGVHAKGHFMEPAIFVDVKPDMEIAREEIFGPVLPVIKVGSLDEALAVHNDSRYGLSASIFTKDIRKAMKAVDALESGVCYVNGPTFGSEVHLPFGGVKMSGNGHREVGRAVLDTFSETKTIYIDYSGEIQNAQFTKNNC